MPGLLGRAGRQRRASRFPSAGRCGMSAPADNGAGALAAPALIKAYAERDMYTALHILARRDTRDHHGSFAAVVASSAAAVLSRASHGDRDQAATVAGGALEV